MKNSIKYLAVIIFLFVACDDSTPPIMVEEFEHGTILVHEDGEILNAYRHILESYDYFEFVGVSVVEVVGYEGVYVLMGDISHESSLHIIVDTNSPTIIMNEYLYEERGDMIIIKTIEGEILYTIYDDDVSSKSNANNGNPTSDVDEVFESWESCMEYSVKACASDWKCAVRCALVSPQLCFGAIALACYVATN